MDKVESRFKGGRGSHNLASLYIRVEPTQSPNTEATGIEESPGQNSTPKPRDRNGSRAEYHEKFENYG